MIESGKFSEADVYFAHSGILGKPKTVIIVTNRLEVDSTHILLWSCTAMHFVKTCDSDGRRGSGLY